MELNEAISLVNQRIRLLKKYHLEPEIVDVKLNQNENPYDIPQEIKDDIIEFVKKRPFNRYPNFIPEELKKKLSEYTGVPAQGILVGNGSNEMLLLLLLSLSCENKDVVLCQPTFTVYSLLVKGLGAIEHTVFLNKDLSFNVDRICETVSQYKKSLLIICSPNNPTGSFLTKEDIKKILNVHTGFFVLDQAYIEFGGYNAIELLKENPNLIITRTFSKAFSCAGIRLGYLLGNPEVAAEINKIKLPYNINFFSEYTAHILLSNVQIIHKRVKEISNRRDSLFEFLKKMPFDNVYPSASNFILIRTSLKDRLFYYLKEKSILVRDVSSYPMLENCLRVNIGSQQETELFQSAIIGFFKQEKML